MELFININRLHSLLVHLPIGILLLAFMMQIFQWWKKENNFEAAIKFSLLIGLIFSALAIFTGWRLAGEGGYEVNAIWWHKWLGVATGVITLLLYLSKNSSNNLLKKLSTYLFIGAVGLLIITGHKGADITHGADYLFSYPIDRSIAVEDIRAANAFETVIFPILDSKCIGCHNPSKLKGGLLMTTQEGLLAGGDEGLIFDFAVPEKSELLQRIHLPMKEKLHMPPKGKQQLSVEEIELLDWWIKNKACFECRVDSLDGSEALMPLLKKYERSSINENAINVDPIDLSLFQDYKKKGIDLIPVSAESNFLNVSLAHNKNITKRQIKLLKNIGENIHELDISHSNFNDNLTYIIQKMPNLKKLGLQHTEVTNKSLSYLKELKFLEHLNLYNTAVNDQSIADLAQIPNLKNIYLWKSKFTATGIEQLKIELPLLAISYNIDENIFGKSELKAPKVIADQFIFKDSVLVYLKSNFPKVKNYYNTDGSTPDSNSQIFIQPFQFKKTTRLKFFAKKVNWEDSPVDSAFFLKGTTTISKVKLNPAPHSNYPGQGSTSIFDLKKGTNDFKDGNWLGYQGNNFSTLFTFEKKKAIQKIYVSSLTHQPSWIFFPKGFKVWTSDNGKDFKLEKTINLPKTQPNDVLNQHIFEIDIPEVQTKYLKIQVINQGKNPDFHASPGEPCWVFVDEIVVE